MSDYAKKCGVGGIFHTDELPPAYGVTAEEVACLREFVAPRRRTASSSSRREESVPGVPPSR